MAHHTQPPPMDPFSERDAFPDLDNFGKVLRGPARGDGEEGTVGIMDCIEMRALQDAHDLNLATAQLTLSQEAIHNWPEEEAEHAKYFATHRSSPDQARASGGLEKGLVLYDPATDSFPEEGNVQIPHRRHSPADSLFSESSHTPSPGSR
eukprot:gb/GEZN01025512.1/.p1 GENE.gb/GEZN01025512.1/~~gb/GEZN01025512.1/.p1  ORF type:complete len:150 (-),score=24.91 gb/GEZN01025512.1/:43-492(-)